MQLTRDQLAWVEKILSGAFSWRELPHEWHESERARVRLEVVKRTVQSETFDVIEDGLVLEKSQRKNCENMVGLVGVPLGVVGPVKLEGEEDFFVPLATTEGALVASVQRGVKAALRGGRVDWWIEDRGMTRAPVFVLSTIEQGKRVADWVSSAEALVEMKKLASSTSNHLNLLKMQSRLVGKNLFVKFFYDTDAAMGMNMVTIATEKLSQMVEQKFGVRCVALSGNGCVDKKPSWGTVMEGRGLYVQFEARISRDIVEAVLKTTPEKIAEVSYRKNLIGGASFGSMGFNAHYANMVAAFYLATGQDMAHTVEGSIGVTTAELEGDDLYFSVTMPNVLMGVVGGGTSLPHQQQSLAMMRIFDKSKEDKKRLARNLGLVVLGGELSLLAALSSGSLAKAHATLGRGR